jgi:transcriptional regulator with XRE-family HTH domain
MISRTKNAVSIAVRDLRRALGESQKSFALRFDTQTRTISLWETVDPPKGGMLKHLARIAQKDANRLDLATIFQRARMVELTMTGQFTHRATANFTHCADGSNWGYVVLWLEGDEEREYGLRIYDAISSLRGQSEGDSRREEFRQALMDFASRVKDIREGVQGGKRRGK